MATAILGGSVEFDALAYGRQHPSTLQFLQTQASAFTQRLSDAGQQWFNTIDNVYKQVGESELARIAKAVGRQVTHIWDMDDIKPLTTMDALQTAKLKMQRWVMAEPTVRALYHSGQCDGYSGSYIDMSPNDIGKDHYDYRRVMDGIVECVEDGDWRATSYLEDLIEDDVELTFAEKVDIIDTWEWVKHYTKLKKDDPTSKYNASL